MKSLSSHLVPCVGLVFAVITSNAQGLITFDDLSLQNFGEPIRNSYAGPANNDGTTTGGFHSLGPLFDFNSAYLTAAWNDGLQVQVSGFVGGLLKYSSAYTLNTTAPTLVNFNFLGIDRVEFISYGGIPHGNPGSGGTQTAIDNLVITVPEPSTTSLLAVGACLVVYWLQKRGWRGRKSL